MKKASVFDPNKVCHCGKIHKSSVEAYCIEKNALEKLPAYAGKYHAKKAYLIADINTDSLAGDRICSLLKKQEIDCIKYVFQDKQLEPDEKAVGSAVMHYDASCDLIIALGSGVINDIGKVLSKITNDPYIVVATAPSMDGYASASSSMAMDGVKITLPAKCPNVIIGDIELLKTAPIRMAKSGLGDMLAKHISICEWRISHLINGEYYCEEVASYVRATLKKCVDNADGLLELRDESIIAVMKGLIGCGMAMEYVGQSRPASGVEHYLSHICDMRGLEFGSPVDLHGIQCAIGTYLSAQLYERLVNIKPSKEKALSYVQNFDVAEWNEELRAFLGKSGDTLIELDKKEQKYCPKKHADRLETILTHWDKILQIIAEEIPSSEQLGALLDAIKAPKSFSEICIHPEIIPMTIKVSKDIRDKYVLSRLLWDLGVLDEFCDHI